MRCLGPGRFANGRWTPRERERYRRGMRITRNSEGRALLKVTYSKWRGELVNGREEFAAQIGAVFALEVVFDLHLHHRTEIWNLQKNGLAVGKQRSRRDFDGIWSGKFGQFGRVLAGAVIFSVAIVPVFDAIAARV